MLSIDDCTHLKGWIIYAAENGKQQARDNVHCWDTRQLLQQVQADIRDLGYGACEAIPVGKPPLAESVHDLQQHRSGPSSSHLIGAREEQLMTPNLYEEK